MCSQVYHQRSDCVYVVVFFSFFRHSFGLPCLFSSWSVVVICFSTAIFIKRIKCCSDKGTARQHKDWVDGTQDDGTLHNPAVIASWPLREPLIKVYYLSSFQVRDRRLKNLSGPGTREVQKIFGKGKLNETNSCTQSNPTKIHTRKGNVKEKKLMPPENSPLPPILF